MGWLDRVRTWGRRPSYPAAAQTTSREQWTVHGLYFDTAGWTLSGGDAHQMSWTATDAVLSVTRLTSEGPWRPDTLTGFRALWRERHRAAGEDIVLVEPLEVSNRMALVVASKARDGLAANY